MSAAQDDQRVFLCPTHQFVVIAWRTGELSSRGTPGHREILCKTCDEVVSQAFAYAMPPAGLDRG